MMDFLSEKRCRRIVAELAGFLPEKLKKVAPVPTDNPFGDPPGLGVRTRWDPVFTGGAVVGFLLTDPAAPEPSRTKDIDLVLEIVSYAQFTKLERVLREAGFTQKAQDNVPVVAWWWKGVRIDFLHREPISAMPTNRWFPFLMDESQRLEILDGEFAWCASAPCFIATKFEAFFARGRGDYLMSKDIEDIIAVVDGRAELLDELMVAAYDVRGFVSQSCRQLQKDRRFMDCLPQLMADEQRETVVSERLLQISEAS